MMKIAAFLLLALSTQKAVSATAAKECCLCEGCADVAQEKIDVITVSPFDAEAGATCGEIAFALLDVEDEDKCAVIQKDYQLACCSAGE